MLTYFLLAASLANIFLTASATTCPSNEVYNSCINGGCGPKNCSDLGKPIKCVKIRSKNCIEGCICKDGYLRNSTGTCVPKNVCTDACGGDPNATPGCGTNCGKTCIKSNICPLFCKLGGCDCKDGFFFDTKLNRCVRPFECTNQCGPNEVFSFCVNTGCRITECSQLGKPISCARSRICRQGCVCKIGYLRDDDGNCVPIKTCPNVRCPNPFEIYDPCFATCAPQTCDSVGKNFNCPFIPVNGSSCNGTCRCINGYFRNNIGECISQADCLRCTGPNEYFSYSALCDNVCPTSSEQSQGNYIMVNTDCSKMCYCNSGFARAANGTCIPSDQCPDNISADIASFSRGNEAFTGEFLYQLFQLNPGESFVASPFSVLIPLAQLVLFAKGTTFDQIMKALNLNTKDQIRSVFPAIINSYENQTEVELILAAKYYADTKYPLSNEFQQSSLKVFQAEVQNIDFGNPSEAAAIINSWVNEETRGLIPNLVNPSLFDASTRLVLTNVIYFLGNWTKQFNPDNTMDRDFFVSNNKSVKIKIMFQENTFNYADSLTLNVQVLQLFYKGGNVSLVVLLPKEKEGISDLVNKLRDGTALPEVLNTTSLEKVRVHLPIVDITSDINLVNILEKDNITSLFDPTSDDLEGILENSERISVSAAKQKSKIKIDETGTEAVAANAIIVSTTAAVFPQPEIFDFVADHPFIFYILLGDDPLFCGCFTGA